MYRPYIITDIEDPVVEYELHGFSDTSAKAYGANIYLRAQTKLGTVKTALVTSKSRVAPIKTTTIPRLELLGNLLLTWLMLSVSNALRQQYDFITKRYWTDSKVTLSWIKVFNKEYKTFIQNRVNEIRSKSDPNLWDYVKTAENPADLITRGETAHAVLVFWREGPLFLKNSKEHWPIENINHTEIIKHSFKVKANNVITFTNPIASPCVQMNEIIKIETHSTLNKLIRVTVWVLRAVKTFKVLIAKYSIQTESSITLKVKEIIDAKTLWIKDNQKYLKQQNNFNLITHQLNIKLDDKGIYRCYGRLQNSPLPYATRFPVVLSQNHKLAELIVRDKHFITNHAGVKQTLTELRQEYWICKGRSFVEKLLHWCITCKKLAGKCYQYPDPPPLTKLRLNDSRPFAVVGVDNCGLLCLKNVFGVSNVNMFKTWVVLFTCALSRGIVLDLVPDLGSDSFVRSLNRFVSRRECPDEVISDNGKNFIATTTQNHASQLNIEWHFNIPLAPWYGGFFERLIRRIKGHLKKQLKNSRLTYEEMQTLLYEIELIVNNRPITYVYPNELEDVLTPNHLLFAWHLESRSLITHNKDDPFFDVTNYPQHLKGLLAHFWNHWRHEYITELRVYQNVAPSKGGPQIKLNDIVLVHDHKVPRSLWRIGKIVELIVSKDNMIRGASVRLPNSTTLKKPISKLYPIETIEYSPQNNKKNDNNIPKSDNTSETRDRKRTRRDAVIVGELRRRMEKY